MLAFNETKKTIWALNLVLNRMGIERFDKSLGRILILTRTEGATVLGSISPVCLTYISSKEKGCVFQFMYFCIN